MAVGAWRIWSELEFMELKNGLNSVNSLIRLILVQTTLGVAADRSGPGFPLILHGP